MPITQILDPANNLLLPIEQAAEHFDEQGLIPAETIYALIKQQVDERNEFGGEHLSPSQITPKTTCRRQMILKRFFDYSQDPFQLWKAMEGSLYHDAFAHSGKDRPGAERELSLPDNHLHASHPLVQVREGRPRIEVFPGVWMRGTVDLLMQSLGTIVDYKTTKYTSKDYWDRQSEEWKPQINIYGYLVELLRECGITHLWAWRLYRGAYDSTKAFRKIPIQKVQRDDLWFELKPWVEETLALLRKANEIYQTAQIKGGEWRPAMETLIRTIGMEGENMFKGNDGSNMCTRYCPVKDLCFGIEGRMNF